ncbi:hypothetical protein [Kitasatospora sp. NBC_01266]|uniref:hypothetical protein n=1 Tax=Kitasatospora sp. NBC_01266 TaxID=2903572 RepID=UPI002E2ED6E7|nr:hypothetical protein [Kitasatospora sp. NBC_01266]
MGKAIAAAIVSGFSESQGVIECGRESGCRRDGRAAVVSGVVKFPLILDSGCLRCGGEVVLQPGSGFEWGEVPELGVPAEPGAVVFDFDEAEDVDSGRFPLGDDEDRGFGGVS